MLSPPLPCKSLQGIGAVAKQATGEENGGLLRGFSSSHLVVPRPTKLRCCDVNSPYNSIPTSRAGRDLQALLRLVEKLILKQVPECQMDGQALLLALEMAPLLGTYTLACIVCDHGFGARELA